MSNNSKNLLVLSIPLVLKYVFLILLVDLQIVSHEDIIEDVCFYLVIILLMQVVMPKRQVFIDILSFLYVFYFVLETTSYLAVSSSFSSSYMYLLIESNKQELIEFTSAYVTLRIILFIILSVTLFFAIRKLRFCFFKNYTFIIGFFSFMSLVAILKWSGFIERNAYHNMVRGVYGYYELQNNFKFNSVTKNDVTITSDNEVLVVVLGESTSRGHMQIYGYERETTPLLNSIKDSLFLYNDVISTDVLTLKAVPKMLSSVSDISKNENSISIVEVFNAAGFETYWLSNQRPISYHDNAINRIASASNTLKFYNHTDDLFTQVCDEVVFPDYMDALKKPGKKSIFIKLIGSHFQYKNRYPEKFNKFKEGNSKKDILINQYDNTVLYNDYIIYNLIKQLQKYSKKSALLYLSDHGENVYDNETDFFGRSEENITLNMFEIPFLLWVSKDFNFSEDFEYVPDRKFTTHHTYESIGQLFGVIHKNMQSRNSVFSESFEERKRIILDKFDFDTYFLKTNE